METIYTSGRGPSGRWLVGRARPSRPAPQDDQLVSKYRILRLRPALRLERRGQHGALKLAKAQMAVFTEQKLLLGKVHGEHRGMMLVSRPFWRITNENKGESDAYTENSRCCGSPASRYSGSSSGDGGRTYRTGQRPRIGALLQ